MQLRKMEFDVPQAVLENLEPFFAEIRSYNRNLGRYGSVLIQVHENGQAKAILLPEEEAKIAGGVLRYFWERAL